MARSDNDHLCRLDVAFVEGVVATERDLETLKEIRARAKTLVALGTCAVWGGLPAMQNEIPREVLRAGGLRHRRVDFLDTVEALPPTRLRALRAARCPAARSSATSSCKVVNALLAGTEPELPQGAGVLGVQDEGEPLPRRLLQRGLLRRHDARRLRRALPVPRRGLRRLPRPGRGAELRRQHHDVRRTAASRGWRSPAR